MYESAYPGWVYIAIIALFALICHLALIEPKEHKGKKGSPYDEVRSELPRISTPKPTPKPKVPEQPKPIPQHKEPKKPTISAETLAAMHIQADAERAIAEALERKAKHIPDPVKRARIEKQAANSWVRFNSILDKLDKLESSV